MFASGLVQYSSNDRVFSSNLRFRWEYLPGSELFVVYTDERDTAYPGFPELENRAFVVKINRLLPILTIGDSAASAMRGDGRWAVAGRLADLGPVSPPRTTSKP